MIRKIYHKAKRKLKKIIRKQMKLETQNLTSAPLDGWKEWFPIITMEQKDAFEDAIKISFIGDMILLRDMVQTAWNANKQTYDFSHLFFLCPRRLRAADLAIGVFV